MDAGDKIWTCSAIGLIVSVIARAGGLMMLMVEQHFAWHLALQKGLLLSSEQSMLQHRTMACIVGLRVSVLPTLEASD